MSRYLYTPLERSRQETRVIEYQCDVLYNDVEIPSFKCKVISLLTPPGYLAISYPCGDVHDLRPVLIDNSVAYIYKNLDLALKDLRRHIGDQLLWTDGLSIDQQDDDEKSYQVLQLQDVYAQADKVLVWLGPGISQLGSVHNVLRDLSWCKARMDADMAGVLRLVPDPHGGEKTYKKDVVMSVFLRRTCEGFSEETVQSLVQFFAMPWWTRVWILQECVLARTIAIYCANAMIDMTLLEQTVQILQHINRLASFSILQLRGTQKAAFRFCHSRYRPFGLRSIYQSAGCKSEVTSLLNLLCFTSIDRRMGVETHDSDQSLFESFDPRDRVFALLSIASDRQRLGIRPNYLKTKNETYIEAARSILSDGNLNVLSTRNRHDPDQQLPSWVPDWTEPIQNSFGFDETIPSDQRLFTATRNMRARIAASPPAVLSLKAIFVESIVSVSGVPEPLKVKEILPDARDLMAKFYECVLAMHTSLTGIKVECDHQLEQFALTSLGGQLWDGHLARYTYPDAPTAIKAFRVSLKWDELPEQNSRFSKVHEYVGLAGVRLIGRQFIFLNTGRIGLATSRASVGDAVYLLPGADIPFVLRPCRSMSGPNHFEIIGEAYVHGIMKGEFLDTSPEMTKIHLI